MKKILAYLLVLVSLMTLFCGTAGAEITFSKTGSAGVYGDIKVTNLDDGSVETRRTCVASLIVTATCKYEGNNPIYPVAAWASKVNMGVTSAGGSVVRIGEPSERTYTGYEGGKRSIIEHYYTATLKATYAPRGSKGTNDNGKIEYHYGSKTSTVTQTVQTQLQFYRR
jgi:hypothetical protein